MSHRQDYRKNHMDLDQLAADALKLCNKRKWDRDWESGGVYLHLESSEFVEALRGKRGDPLSEAADVLFVLMSTMAHHGLSIDEAINTLHLRISRELNDLLTVRI